MILGSKEEDCSCLPLLPTISQKANRGLVPSKEAGGGQWPVLATAAPQFAQLASLMSPALPGHDEVLETTEMEMGQPHQRSCSDSVLTPGAKYG